jgi:hypothetical protein
MNIDTEVSDGEIKPKYYLIVKKYLKKAGISIAEWHSLIIGVGTAIIGGPTLASAVFTGVTSVKAKKLKGHMKDVKHEIGYFIASYSITEGIIHVLTGVLG